MIDDDITQLLHSWRGGDEAAMHALVTQLYDELRRVARGHMRGERSDHTLEPTALVHAAYERLHGLNLDWKDRNHFLSMASRVMRRVLVDHARSRLREKRGGDQVRVTLGDDRLRVEDPEALLIVSDALDSLGEVDERKHKLLELHYFGGLTYAELAEAEQISEATVHRDLRLAKAFVARALENR